MNRTMLMLLPALLIAGVATPAAAQQPLSVADRLEIQELYARYAHGFDFGDGEAWANTFTEDGVFNETRGREALAAYAERRYEESYHGNARHWNDQLLLTPTPEGATAVVYLKLWDVGTQPPTILRTGVYHDVLAKTAEGWRFRERAVEWDGGL